LYNRLAFRSTKESEIIYSKKGKIRFGKGKKVSIFAAAKKGMSSGNYWKVRKEEIK